MDWTVPLGDKLQTPSLTEFQIKCREKVIALFASKKLTVGFDIANLEEDELYLHALVRTESHVLALYIYEDAAGFKLDRNKWTIFEPQDFDSQLQLMDAFCSQLGEYL